MKAKMLILLLAVAVASAGLTFSIMRKSTTAPVPAEEHAHEGEEAHGEHEGVEIAGLKTAVAIAGEGWDIIAATGKVSVPHDRLVKVTPRIEGKVVSARGTVGDTVSRGQMLAVISSVELAEARSIYRQASAKLRAAQSNYDREIQIAELGATSARPYEEACSESLAAQGELADTKSELAQAISELAREESELIQCKARLQRAKDLYTDQIVSKADLETAEAEYKRDSASVETAKSKVNQSESRIEKAKSKVELAKQYQTREEKVYKSRVLDMRSTQAAKSEVSAARIEVQAAADRIRVLGANPGGSGETIVITSPISGRIVSRNTNVGEMASPENPLFTIANLGQVWVEADVYEKDLARIRRGQSVEIRVDTYPDKTFSGKVSSISDLLNSDSRTAKVRCVVSNSQGLLRGEMFAKISIISEKRGNSVLILKEAVLDDAGKKIVFTPCMDCKEDIKAGKSMCGSYDKLEVTTGPAHGDNVEVLSGVEPGTEVVTVGAYQLKTALGSGQLEAGCTDH